MFRMSSRRRCAIIGAGASGLTSTRWALAYGVEPIVFEKTTSIGGLWRYNPNEKEHSGVMATTTANTSKEMSAFSDFPPPDDAPVFMRNADMLRYLRAYADHHRLVDHIRFRHTVTLVERADDYDTTGRWTLHYRNDADGTEHVETFDAVLICHGNQKPLKTGIERKNWEQFRGRIMHACEVKNSRDFADTVNVVVGFKPSATDIAVELSRVADKVYLSTRSGGYALTRVSQGGGGRPLDMTFGRFNKYVLSRLLPMSLQEKLLKAQYLAGFDHEKCGLVRRSDSILAKGVTISDELASRVICGAVILRPDIAEYTAHGVRWTDGTEVEHVDNVIFASGYAPDSNLVESGRLIPAEESGYTFLYQSMLPPQLADHNTLGIINILHVFGPTMPTFELMARCFFEQLAGVSRLPAPAKMAKIVADERHSAYERARRTNCPLRNQLLRDAIPFWDSLAALIGCQPQIWRTFLTDPRLAWALCFGPNASYAYRLRGPHPWPGARDAILGIQRRIEYPLARSYPAPAVKAAAGLSEVGVESGGGGTARLAIGLAAAVAALAVFLKLFTL